MSARVKSEVPPSRLYPLICHKDFTVFCEARQLGVVTAREKRKQTILADTVGVKRTTETDGRMARLRKR